MVSQELILTRFYTLVKGILEAKRILTQCKQPKNEYYSFLGCLHWVKIPLASAVSGMIGKSSLYVSFDILYGLTHFSSMFRFYTSWNQRFSNVCKGIEVEHRPEMS